MTSSSLTVGGLTYTAIHWMSSSDALTSSFDENVDEPAGLPQWHSEALAELAKLEGLVPGWDGYAGLPVSRLHANRALRFLGQFMEDGLPMPEIVPLADGGVQLEWHLPAHRVDFVSDDENPTSVVMVEKPGQEVAELPAGSYSADVLRALFGSGPLPAERHDS